MKQSNQSGFSLVEAMVAIAIFAIGILGAYKMQLHSTQGVALANRVSSSASWASYAIEELLGKPYDHEDFRDDGGKDDGTGVANGELDDPIANADGVLYVDPDGSIQTAANGDEIYSIYWNIAQGGQPGNLNTTDIGHPNYIYEVDTILNDVKQVRVFVVRNGGIGDGPLYRHDYFKAKWPESE